MILAGEPGTLRPPPSIQRSAVLSRTDRTVPDYGVYARHMTGHWPVDTDSGALAGRAALIYESEAQWMPGQRPGHATLS
jgi:hypothetical protein